MFRLLLTLVLFFVVGLESASAQLSIANFSEATNNRFTNDANFIGAGYDFSGVAIAASRPFWGTLISPNAALTAQHLSPSAGIAYQFYPNNDPNSTPFEAIVTNTFRVGNSDLSIAILDRNVDPSITVYSFATDEYMGDPPTNTGTFFNTDPSQVGIVGQRALVFGRSQTDFPNVTTDQAVGENLVLGYSENVNFLSNTDNDAIIFENDAIGSANFLTHESYVQSGDSGAPTFLIDSATNELVLLGVNSFRLDGAAPSTFQSTGVTYTGNLVNEINAILSANIIEPTLLGDCNLDGVVNFLDISHFIVLISTSDYLEEADINLDGTVNFLDIGPFILLLN